MNKYGPGERLNRARYTLPVIPTQRESVKLGTLSLILINWMIEGICLVVIGAILYCLIIRPDLLVEFLTLGGGYFSANNISDQITFVLDNLKQRISCSRSRIGRERSRH